MEGVPQCLLHHMQGAISTLPCCETPRAQPAWSLVPNPRMQEQVGGMGEGGGMVLLKGIPASHNRPWWGAPRGDPEAAASHGTH